MEFFRVRPVRPCNIWNYSRVDENGRIESVVFAWDFPSREPIFQDVPHFFLRDSVACDLSASSLAGFSLKAVPTIRSKEFYVAPGQEDIQLEDVQELIVHGRHGMDDFGRQYSRLILSERAVDFLRARGMREARVFEYDPDYSPSLERLP